MNLSLAAIFHLAGTLAVVYEDTGIGIWHAGGAAIERYEPIAGNVSRLAWVDSGRSVAVPLQPASIRLVPRSGDATVLVHPKEGPDPRSVIATPKAGALIANYVDGSLWRWDLAGERATLPIVSAETAGGGAKGAMSLSIGPKGQWIAATRVDDLLRLYSLSGEHALVELRLRSPNTKTVAFAPSGPRFAALGADGQVTVWRVQGTTSTPLLSVSAAPARSKAGQSESLARRVSWIAWRGAQRLIAATVAGNVLVLNLAEADWRMRAEEIALWVD